MTEALRHSALPAAVLARAANGAPLRLTPGPDELRLPFEDDEPVPLNTRQFVAMVDCFNGLREHWRGRRDMFVGADQFIHWDRDYDPCENPDNPPVSPDVYVAFGVADRHRRSYVLWEEGKPPDFVLEVVSPSSRRRDEKEKPAIYAKIGVPEFFLYDPDGKLEPALSGFELCCGEYVPLSEEALPGGVVGVRSKVLGLCLCLRPPGPEPLDISLCWYDPAVGEFLPSHQELAAQKRAAEAARRAEEAARRMAEAKAAALQAQIEKMQRR